MLTEKTTSEAHRMQEGDLGGLFNWIKMFGEVGRGGKHNRGDARGGQGHKPRGHKLRLWLPWDWSGIQTELMGTSKQMRSRITPRTPKVAWLICATCLGGKDIFVNKLTSLSPWFFRDVCECAERRSRCSVCSPSAAMCQSPHRRVWGQKQPFSSQPV